MSDRPLAPKFPDEPLSLAELRLRKANARKPVAELTLGPQNWDHVGPPSGHTCKCGSTRVYRVQDRDNEYRTWLRCFNCWRRW